LAVMPGDLFDVFGRTLRGAKGAYPFRHELRLVDMRVRRPNGLALVDLVGSLAGDDTGKGLRVPVSQFQTDLPRHRRPERHRRPRLAEITAGRSAQRCGLVGVGR
jgi:hypothetical protein